MCMKQKTPKPQLIAKQAAPAKSAQAELDMDMTDAETDGEIRKKKRTGKKGLTVSRNTGAQYNGGGGTGLNIPTK
jgi:hypothetical protein